MSVAEAPLASGVVPHRWTVDQFMALLGADVFEEGWRFELLEGIVVMEMPPGVGRAVWKQGGGRTFSGRLRSP